jgi:hypothetical protein
VRRRGRFGRVTVWEQTEVSLLRFPFLGFLVGFGSVS